MNVLTSLIRYYSCNTHKINLYCWVKCFFFVFLTCFVQLESKRKCRYLFWLIKKWLFLFFTKSIFVRLNQSEIDYFGQLSPYFGRKKRARRSVLGSFCFLKTSPVHFKWTRRHILTDGSAFCRVNIWHWGRRLLVLIQVHQLR